MEDLPYLAEYAKTGRSSCRGCRTPIAQGEVRLAVMVQSAMFDGRQPNWYHFTCFFNKQRVKTVDDIEKYETLRSSDQDRIKAEVGKVMDVIIPDKKGKKRKGEAAAKKSALKDFTLEYAKSGRAMCRGCEIKILKDEIRISKKDFDTDVGKKYGGQDMWHHLSCFAKLRSELGYYECGDQLPGFRGLKKDDQAEVLKQLPPIKQEEIPEVKKVKKEEEDETEKTLKEQNTIMYKFRDKLSKLQKRDLKYIYEYNHYTVPEGLDEMLNVLADFMTFGVPVTCKVCNGGNYVYSRNGYICIGDLTEWTKCNNIIKEPERKKLKIPKDLKEEHSVLKKYKYVPRVRVIKNFNPTNSTNGVKKEEEGEHKPKIERAKPPLYEMQFVILGQNKDKEGLKKKIVKLGGKVVTKISDSVMAVIATPQEVEKMGARMMEVESQQIHVVTEDFLDEAKDYVDKIPDLVIKKSICDWGSDPTKRLPAEPSTSYKSAKSRSIYTSKVPSKLKLKLKGGIAVDPDSGLDEMAHVYVDKNDKYTVVLGLTDVQKKKNSYYKLQLLEKDGGNKYWLFRAWGRIGTTIGDNKLESFHTLNEAKKQFESLYNEKTGNYWETREHFVKVPGLMYPIDVEYADDETSEKLDIVNSESNLAKPVQDLIRMIFDVNTMKKLMMEFELDTEKMPLGKLSKAQIQKAYSVLTELQTLIDEENKVPAKFIDASNRFYTFIPHSFGVDNPPILDDKETIKQKLDMLDSLMELEIAYNLMQSSGSEHTVDSYYKQLNTELNVVERESEEFGLLQEYVRNTHAETHGSYDLQIDEVFQVKRSGEEKRFKPFKKLHNRKLLWHGSRVTNFAGILSQGLRIAPPEAPVTGYMFGKGIYFADMVSKSANYCSTSPGAPDGLLLLCDVALGDMYERTQAEMIQKLPKGKHSCKGLGRTEPDPIASKVVDGIEIPLGKGKLMDDRKTTSLLYNEYIVYDVAQVNVKYLLKLKFNYKY